MMMGTVRQCSPLRILPWLCSALIFVLVGCGGDIDEDTHLLSDTPAEMTTEHTQTLNRLPHQSLRPLPLVDEKGYPIDPHAKEREARFVENPSAYEDTDNDPRFVRETGFRPVNEYEDEENDPRFVRETGFMPAPIIRLLELRDGVATIAWNPVPGAGSYLVEGVRFSMDGAPAQSFDARSQATRHDLDTEGELTVITVVAISPNGKERSAQSNKLTIGPLDP